MVAPIVMGIVSALAQNGLGMLAGAIQAKGKEVIEEKLGIKIPDDPAQLTPELVAELRIKEMEHEEFLVTAQIEKAKVDLEAAKAEHANTASARDMNARIQESDKADRIAKVAAYYLDFLIVGATLILTGLVVFTTIPDGNKELAFAAMGSLWTLCGTVVNFHRGSSSGSKSSADTLRKLVARDQNDSTGA